MVDESLLKEIKAAQDAGASAASAEDVMKMYEFIKQISKENEDLKEELEDMDIAISMII
ncbi:MAG: hypothetical protein GWN45_09170, partial [Gammaproteobacteria bacterium]|nr:hypothetical protein [Gammaproteobacteria bacterium]